MSSHSGGGGGGGGGGVGGIPHSVQHMAGGGHVWVNRLKGASVASLGNCLTGASYCK